MSIVYVVGLGPGAGEQMTAQARQALEQCPVIAGYTVYIDLIREEFPEKQFLMTPMRKEAERCKMALEQAQQGQDVAMVCSGDAGVYGMAGLMYELKADYPGVELKIVPGITAATGGAAVLGAPLMHDFAVISLSDLLTPWEKIEARLRAAAAADFVICIYNPSSRKRKDHLARACRICGNINVPIRSAASSKISDATGKKRKSSHWKNWNRPRRICLPRSISEMNRQKIWTVIW